MRYDDVGEAVSTTSAEPQPPKRVAPGAQKTSAAQRSVGSSRRGNGVGATVLLCAATAIVVSTAFLLAQSATVPPSLVAAGRPESIPLVAEQLTDSRSVELSVHRGEPEDIGSPAAGRITSSTCQAGAAVTSGTTTMAVNGAPLLNLSTGTPLWRDLAYDDKGADVEALQAELARLGYAPGSSGRFDWSTWDAYRKLLKTIGVKAEDGVLSLSQIVWMRQPSQPVAGCTAKLGQEVAAGDPLMALPAAALSAAVSEYPADLVPGIRILTVDDVQLAVDAAGAVASADDLQRLSATASYQAYAADPEGTKLTGDLLLAAPLTVYPVTPGSIVTGKDATCVVSDGAPLRVSVVGSKLGRTFVTFADADIPKRVDAVPAKGAACS